MRNPNKAEHMDEDMHILMGKYFAGEASEEEQTILRNWMLSDEQHASDFNLLQKFWTDAGNHSNIEFNTDAAWKKVSKETGYPGKSALIRTIPKWVVGIAALLILSLGIWWIAQSPAAMNEVVAKQEVETLKLSDGTVVYLRKGAHLKYPEKFDGPNRNVSLSGEAFFNVAHDASRPFRIAAGNAEVQVLGTSFNLNNNNGQVELVVKTGRVNFSAKSNTSNKILVIAGERAVLLNDRLSKEANTDPNFNSWETRQLTFTGTPLEQVIEQLNDYYHVQIELNKQEGEQLRKTKITCIFKDQPLNSVLDELSIISTYRIQKIGDDHYEISLK